MLSVAVISLMDLIVTINMVVQVLLKKEIVEILYFYVKNVICCCFMFACIKLCNIVFVVEKKYGGMPVKCVNKILLVDLEQKKKYNESNI